MAIHYFTASSLDGYISSLDDNLDWLLSRNVDPDGPQGINAFMSKIGAIVMGGVTYRWVIDYETAAGRPWPYALPTWVFTRRDEPVVEEADIRFTYGRPEENISEIIESAGGKDVWLVGGGDLAAQFAQARLIDELWVQFAPVLLGAGKPFLPFPLDLELLDAVRNGDIACTRFKVLKPA